MSKRIIPNPILLIHLLILFYGISKYFNAQKYSQAQNDGQNLYNWKKIVYIHSNHQCRA